MSAAMRWILLVTFLLVLSPTSSQAQVLGHVLAGPAGFSGFFGSSASFVHAAGGVEVLGAGRAGGQAEFGIIAGSGSALWVLSANGVWHLTPTRAGAPPSPFVAGGYSRLSSGEGFNAWNVGVGVDIRTGERIGLRLEFRDHIRPDSRGVVQYWTLRGGVVFG